MELTLDQARAEATALLEKDKANYALRSCWNCNSAHEHLREAEYVIMCFGCGHWFFKGVQLSESDEESPTTA